MKQPSPPQPLTLAPSPDPLNVFPSIPSPQSLPLNPFPSTSPLAPQPPAPTWWSPAPTRCPIALQKRKPFKNIFTAAYNCRARSKLSMQMWYRKKRNCGFIGFRKKPLHYYFYCPLLSCLLCSEKICQTKRENSKWKVQSDRGKKFSLWASCCHVFVCWLSLERLSWNAYANNIIKNF